MTNELGNSKLTLHRCPHCSVSLPNLSFQAVKDTASHDNKNPRRWATYMCHSCGGLVLAASMGGGWNKPVLETYPENQSVDEAIPSPASDYLQQAIESLHAASGCIMLCASSVDAMLKDKGYVQGVLNSRIIEARDNHLITPEMADWAHEIRLDANDQRHADQNVGLPTQDDAKKCLEFAQALGEFLYVLPDRIQRGRAVQPPAGQTP